MTDKNSNNMDKKTGIDSEYKFKTGDADSYNPVVDYFDEYTEKFTRHLPESMMDMANINDGDNVLDVGTGTGVVAIAAAERYGDSCRLTGIDLSDGMLETARNKVRSRNLQGQVVFRKMDAEKLTFDNQSFDAALSLYALRHFPNPGKSVEEIYRVLKPGGRLVVAVGSRPKVASIEGLKAISNKISGILRKYLGKELTACDFIDGLTRKYINDSTSDEEVSWAKHTHEFTGSINDIIVNSGFINTKSTWKGQYSLIATPEQFWELQMTFSSFSRKRILQTDREKVEEMKKEFYRQCEDVLRRNGRLVYKSGAAIVSGEKPE